MVHAVHKITVIREAMRKLYARAQRKKDNIEKQADIPSHTEDSS
jgi:hypothetical protein